jgi:hypothetical protein
MELDGITWVGPRIDDAPVLDELPGDLSALLSQVNGFVLRGGALHVRGAVSTPAWHSVRRYWTGEHALARMYGHILPSDVPFAQDCVGDQFFLREGRVWKLSAESDEAKGIELTLFAFLEACAADPMTLLSPRPLIAFREDGMELHPGQLLHVYPPYVMSTDSDRSVRAIPAEEVILVHARLAAEIRDLPDGTSIRIVVPRESKRMPMIELTSEDWRRVDSLLAESQVLSAVALYREVARCETAEAKAAVGERFRVEFPDLWRSHRNIEDQE